jgi:hypothetical protein
MKIEAEIGEITPTSQGTRRITDNRQKLKGQDRDLVLLMPRF